MASGCVNPSAFGPHVASKFLHLRPDLPVVLCSGPVTENLKQRARDIGIREVLYKPTTIQEFSETLRCLAATTKSS